MTPYHSYFKWKTNTNHKSNDGHDGDDENDSADEQRGKRYSDWCITANPDLLKLTSFRFFFVVVVVVVSVCVFLNSFLTISETWLRVQTKRNVTTMNVSLGTKNKMNK